MSMNVKRIKMNANRSVSTLSEATTVTASSDILSRQTENPARKVIRISTCLRAVNSVVI